MTELRQDPLSGRYVIIGNQRSTRPNEFIENAIRRTDGPCPFCAGNESQTPPAIATIAAPGNPRQWQVRVVPNKYPAVTQHPNGTASGIANGDGFYPTHAFGQHEVIIESPRHVSSFTDLTEAESQAAFQAYRDRLRALRADGRFRYAQIFKNVGPAAGASLEHVHSQLVAIPFTPEVVQAELANSQRYLREKNRCVLCDMAQRELQAGVRLVAATSRYVAFCPFASRFAYEMWVLPRQHQSTFETLEAGELGELARFMREVVGRIESAAGRIAYNYFLHSLPFDSAAHDHYHWHIEIFPRLTKVAGFEWSTGVFINTVPPELAALELRSTPLPMEAASGCAG